MIDLRITVDNEPELLRRAAITITNNSNSSFIDMRLFFLDHAIQPPQQDVARFFYELNIYIRAISLSVNLFPNMNMKNIKTLIELIQHNRFSKLKN
jgi:hypothetical protein